MYISTFSIKFFKFHVKKFPDWLPLASNLLYLVCLEGLRNIYYWLYYRQNTFCDSHRSVLHFGVSLSSMLKPVTLVQCC